MELSVGATLTFKSDVACAAIYRSNPLWYDVTSLLSVGDENVKVDLENGRRVHLNPVQLYLAAYRTNGSAASTTVAVPSADGECRAARHLQLQVTGDKARFEESMPAVSDPLRPVTNPAAQTRMAEVSESHMTLSGGAMSARYTQALGAKIPFVEMLNSPVARDQATQINYLSLKITLTEVEGRTVQTIDMIVERDQVVDIEALKTELGVGEITLISDDSNLCVK